MLPRLARCGHTAVDGQGVVVRCSEGRAGFAGLATCGSVWACPVCASKVAAQRATDLTGLLEAMTGPEHGYRAALMTFTVRHHAGQSLREVWDAVAAGWGRVCSGKGWATDRARHEVPGVVRAIEATHGAHGWHVHVHALVLFRGSGLDAAHLGASMWGRWVAGIEKLGFTAVAESGGFDVQVAQAGDDDLGGLGRYLAKQGAEVPGLEGLAREAVMGSQKKARGQNRTPLQIAQTFVETGDLDDLDLWHEWEKGSKGRRQIVWTRGLRDLAGLGQELSDEEIAAEETGSAADDLVLLPSETWRAVRAESWRLLDQAEAGGRAGLTAWLDERALPWLDPPDRSPL